MPISRKVPENKLQLFNNPEFGEVRTIREGGTVLFCGNDVAKALGYKNPRKAVGDHCRGVTKRYITDNLGRKQEANFIPEGDIFRLAAKSELPGAEKFESWIFDEVLPSIRRTGSYNMRRPRSEVAAELNQQIEEIVSYLNARAGKRFRPNNESTRRLIVARLSEGYTVDDFFCVIDTKVAQWSQPPANGRTDMRIYLRPATLFGGHFESYLNEPIDYIYHPALIDAYY